VVRGGRCAQPQVDPRSSPHPAHKSSPLTRGSQGGGQIRAWGGPCRPEPVAAAESTWSPPPPTHTHTSRLMHHRSRQILTGDDQTCRWWAAQPPGREGGGREERGGGGREERDVVEAVVRLHRWLPPPTVGWWRRPLRPHAARGLAVWGGCALGSPSGGQHEGRLFFSNAR
jgi:hypothetical protein